MSGLKVCFANNCSHKLKDIPYSGDGVNVAEHRVRIVKVILHSYLILKKMNEHITDS